MSKGIISQTDNIDYFILGSIFTIFITISIVSPISTILYSYNIILFGNNVTLWHLIICWFTLFLSAVLLVWTVRVLKINLSDFVKSLVTGGS